VESELERRLATAILHEGALLVRRRVARGETLVEQGESARDLFVLLDGVFHVEIDGEVVAEVGSGAIVGERALLGDGLRTATSARRPVVARRGDRRRRDRKTGVRPRRGFLPSEAR
jgi:CRP-like cAMP-binding protein